MSDPKNNGDVEPWHWTGKLFCADDLRQWRNQRELILPAKALLTPLALDELKARGVRITRQSGAVASEKPAGAKDWGWMQERPDPTVAAAVAALEREGHALAVLNFVDLNGVKAYVNLGTWLSGHTGAVLFCQDASLVCCLANKVAGIRAATVAGALAAGRALKTLGANVLVVDMAERTFFEIRQILRTAVSRGAPSCPAPIAQQLRELEVNAHR